MERTKKDDQTIRWRNGGGIFRFSNHTIKPGEVFKARPDQIPKAFRDTIKPVDPLPEEKPLAVVDPGYTVQFHSRGWYNVVNKAGKKINEKLLRKGEAEKLIQELGG